MRRKRLASLLIFLFLTGIEVLIALFVKDGFIRPFVGDVLVVAVIYYFIRIFFPTGIKYLLCYIFVFATMIELAQLLGLTQLISGNNRLLRILLGTSFSFMDIVCYAAGCAAVYMAEYVTKKVKGKRVIQQRHNI